MRIRIIAALIIAFSTILQPVQATDTFSGEMGLAIGAAGLDAKEYGDLTGLGLDLTIRCSIFDSIFDIEGRLTGAQYDLDDICVLSTYYNRYREIVLDDVTLTTSSLRLQIVANLARDAVINPYVVAGCLIKGIAIDYESSHYYYDDYIEEDKNDTTYCVGAGLRVRLQNIYTCSEVSYIGETFDSESDIVLYGKIGYDFQQGVRLCIIGSFYTEESSWMSLIGFDLYL